MDRPSVEEYFLSLALMAAARSTCLRRKTGAVVIIGKKILGTGYNGAPAGLKHCIKIGCIREDLSIPSGERFEHCRGLHAEENAIRQALKTRDSLEGSEMYCTNHPCVTCAKPIIDERIRGIVALEDYSDDLAKEMFREADIPVKIFQGDIKEIILQSIYDQETAEAIIEFIKIRERG